MKYGENTTFEAFLEKLELTEGRYKEAIQEGGGDYCFAVLIRDRLITTRVTSHSNE